MNDDQNLALEQKVLNTNLEIPESVLVEYKPGALRVGTELVAKGFASLNDVVQCYIRGYLPTEVQEKRGYTKIIKNQVINSSTNVVLSTGMMAVFSVKYYPDIPTFWLAFSSLSLLCSSMQLGSVAEGRKSCSFLLSEALYATIKSVVGKYKNTEQQLINQKIIKHAAEKKVGTLSLPAPSEEGRLSLEDKTGAVSYTSENDNFDSSLF